MPSNNCCLLFWSWIAAKDRQLFPPGKEGSSAPTSNLQGGSQWVFKTPLNKWLSRGYAFCSSNLSGTGFNSQSWHHSKVSPSLLCRLLGQLSSSSTSSFCLYQKLLPELGLNLQRKRNNLDLLIRLWSSVFLQIAVNNRWWSIAQHISTAASSHHGQLVVFFVCLTFSCPFCWTKLPMDLPLKGYPSNLKANLEM